MTADRILDKIESVTSGTLSTREKALVIASINSNDFVGKTTTAQIKEILRVVNAVASGDYVESSSQSEKMPIINQEEIDKYIEKMTGGSESDAQTEDFFDDTFEEAHPMNVFEVDGYGRHRSDFNTKI